jgi:eukaryotic-like serine/threonine-protein kinase
LSGRYVLLEEIGRGGMAVVYLSWDIVLRRVVAIKVLRPDTADPESLMREAAATLDLTHEGIVRLYHFEPRRHGTEPYLVMEYLPWPSGEKWIAEPGRKRLLSLLLEVLAPDPAVRPSAARLREMVASVEL